MKSERTTQRNRDRQHGADIAADQRRGSIGNAAKRAVLPGVAVLVAAALIYEAGGAAGQEETSAAQKTAPIEKALNERPPTPPAGIENQ